MPTADEARLLAGVRCDIGALMELDVQYTDAVSVLNRYADLMRGRPATEGAIVQMEMALC